MSDFPFYILAIIIALLFAAVVPVAMAAIVYLPVRAALRRGRLPRLWMVTATFLVPSIVVLLALYLLAVASNDCNPFTLEGSMCRDGNLTGMVTLLLIISGSVSCVIAPLIASTWLASHGRPIG